MTIVQIPQNAMSGSPDGNDIAAPVVGMLNHLNLLPTDADMKESEGFKAIFTGPASSVSVLEAGATALSKWWAVGLGASAVGLWASVRIFWTSLPQASQEVMMWSVAISSAAAVLALAYVLGSDVRGRAAAMVATIEARRAIATSMIGSAERAYDPVGGAQVTHSFPLPTPMPARQLLGRDTGGWLAIALEVGGPKTRYLLVRGNEHLWVDDDNVEFEDGHAAVSAGKVAAMR